MGCSIFAVSLCLLSKLFLSITNQFSKQHWIKVQKHCILLDKSIHLLFATFQSQSPDPGLGGLKIWGGISQFCAVNIGFPTMDTSFEQRNEWNLTIIHRDFLSINKFKITAFRAYRSYYYIIWITDHYSAFHRIKETNNTIGLHNFLNQLLYIN